MLFPGPFVNVPPLSQTRVVPNASDESQKTSTDSNDVRLENQGRDCNVQEVKAHNEFDRVSRKLNVHSREQGKKQGEANGSEA